MIKAFKAIGSLFRMAHPGGSSSLLWRLPRSKHNYASEVGDGTNSSVIMAPVQWIQRNLPTAPIIVSSRKNGRVVGHPLENLLTTPNDFYNGAAMWSGIIFDWCMTGNGYLLKVRNQFGQPVALWYVPSWMITPKWPAGSTDIFISHYEYKPAGETYELPVQDVVHFRHGIDPNNPRLGMSPLKSVLREIWSDDEASNWIAALLKNSGVPGLVLSPKSGATTVGLGDVASVKQYIKDSFSGDRRGEPLVMSGPTDVKEFGYSPQKMDLSHVRNVAEERVSAALGLPAAVIGFGTGLENTQVGATMREFYRAAWSNCVCPMQNSFSSEIGRSLLPDFESNPQSFEVSFDRSQVEALQEDQTASFTRANTGVAGGWLTVAQAKRMAGLEPDENDDIYLRTPGMIEVPIGMTMGDVQAEKNLLLARRTKLRRIR